MEHSRPGEFTESTGEKPDLYKDVFSEAEIIDEGGLRTLLVPPHSIDIFIEKVKDYGHGVELFGDKIELAGIWFVFGVDQNTEFFFLKEKLQEEYDSEN